MTEQTAETGTETTETSAQGTAAGEQQAASTDETDWKAEARKWEQRAKENGTKVRTLEQQQRASMTDAEKALAEAEQRGKTAATVEMGTRLARTSFDAAAARRNPDFDITGPLEYLDLAKFLDDSGEPDEKAITAAVERLVPEPAGNGRTSYDGGSRTSAAGGVDMNQIIRRAAGRG